MSANAVATRKYDASISWADMGRVGASHAGERPLRVLQATARYFPYTGGVETHVYEVARRLAERGTEVTVLSTDPTGQLPAEEQKDGVHLLRVRAWPNKEDLYIAPRLYESIANGNWDVVHCQGIHTLAAPLIMFASWKAKIPYVVTFHTGGHSCSWRNAIRGAQWRALKPFLAWADKLIGVSRFEADLFRTRLRLPGRKFTVIPNGSNLPRPESEICAPGQDGTLIVSVGRLERYKGHHQVIAALPRLLQARPDVHLRIIGSGPYEAALRAQARDLGVAEHVEIGPIPPTDRHGMACALSRASLAVLLSEYEAHPIAVMEALSLGVPMLVADTSGLREIAEQGFVRAMPLNSTPEEVAGAINQQLALPRPTGPTSLTLPTWDNCVNKLSALYSAAAKRTACVS